MLKKSMYQDIMSDFELIDKDDILIIGNLFSDIIPANELNIDSLMIEGSFSFDMSQNYPCKKIPKLKKWHFVEMRGYHKKSRFFG